MRENESDGAGGWWQSPEQDAGTRRPGAGATVAFGGHSTAPAAGVSSSDVPGPHDNASGSGASAAPLNVEAVRKKVDPGLVDIMSNLKFNGETAEGTGMIISSSGLVLTNNHVIDQSTS